MNHPVINVDVLVVGLGPAGSSAACSAAAAGRSVLAIDSRKQVGHPVQCAEFIPLPMQCHASTAVVRSQTIDGMLTQLPSGECTVSDFHGRMIHRRLFDTELANKARASGAMIRTATRLLKLDPINSRTLVRWQGAQRQVSFRTLIAADGPRSNVAKQLGAAYLPVVNTRQYTLPLLTPLRKTKVWLTANCPGGYAWLFPKTDIAHLGLGLDGTRKKNLQPLLDELHADLVDRKIVGKAVISQTGGAIPVGGLRESLVHGNIVFVGDAAGLTHPITGAGIAAAIISGEQAGLAVSRYLQGESAALVEYESDIRDQFQASLQRAVRRRGELLQRVRQGKPLRDAEFRRAWIAFDEYYAAR